MRIAVYAGSSGRTAPAFLDEARALGALIGARGHELVYGGGRTGSMGALADGTLAAGGRVTGVIYRRFVEEDVHHAGVSMIEVDDMRSRKAGLEERADAFIAAPGGLGTFEEFTEVLSFRKLAFHERPLVLLNRTFYSPWVELFQRAVEAGFERREHGRFFAIADTPEDAISICEAP